MSYDPFALSPEIAAKYPGPDRPLSNISYETKTGARSPYEALCRKGPFDPFMVSAEFEDRPEAPPVRGLCLDGLGDLPSIDTYSEQTQAYIAALRTPGFDPFAVSPHIAAKYPKDVPLTAGVFGSYDGPEDTLTFVTPEIAARYPDKAEPQADGGAA
ncbi:hypothetical protein BAJUN_02000 [Bajunvirus bajun]|uniref:Uncharacterized protein n=1 Tax=Brevundimonas phage vB_BgoS-Bajun TaxID=2948594 RepID=A0A9E7N6E8_9CAUD|nr:hypothetical protein BAJUN_02000 [Brevundimonas phage vB_BgoS-Bajun]